MENKDITFYSHGACNEVTGSKHFIKIDKDIIQLDCGMFQGRRKESYRKNLELNFSPAEVSAILLSHGHFDHSGALPIMVKKGFGGNIYSTSATRDIANIILLDSAYIQQKDLEYLQKKANKYPDRGLTLRAPFYNSQDALDTMGHFVTINYHRDFSPVPGVKVNFFDAGHILGSAMVCLNIDDKMKVGFSGDLGRKKLPILRDPEIMPDLDYLVLEGTYGNRLHDTYGMAKEDLAKVVNRAYKRGGKIIIPAFTIERTQELIYILHLLVMDQKIPDIPIYVDSPMAVNATSIFKIHPECFDKETFDNFISVNLDPFGFNQIRYVSSVRESKKINEHTGPAVIISASGMAEVGRILHHLRNNIENPANIIAIVGFMAEHTLGRRLVEGFKEIKIFGKKYRVNAEVKTLNAFSAHADYNEIKEWVKQYDLKKLKKIFLVHGEKEALLSLRKELLSIGVNDVKIAGYDNTYELEY
ncbi:MAG: MBL fold metallo-hydrolase [Candidatus Aminicenantes bacterium]|nr:MBL fold metallo-hydrolase [Candidatus Aminicenantes bacterium]